MYCPNCGEQIQNTANFCSNCGTKQDQLNKEKEVLTEIVNIEKCEKCNENKRNIYIGTNFTGKRICTICDIKPGICPNCGSQLRTNKAQQCKVCKASWREISPSSEIESIKTDSSNEIKCPKCKSKSITANKEGFGLGKAVVGGVLTGGVGLLGGFIGSNKIRLTCLNCGHIWKPGK